MHRTSLAVAVALLFCAGGARGARIVKGASMPGRQLAAQGGRLHGAGNRSATDAAASVACAGVDDACGMGGATCCDGLTCYEETACIEVYKRGRAASPDPDTVAKEFQLGLKAMVDGILPFMRDPPNIAAGMAIFDDELWEVLTPLVPANAAELSNAKVAWDRAFAQMPSSIDGDVKNFGSKGDTEALTKALESIMDLGLKFTQEKYPEAAQYFLALQDLSGGLGECWKLFSNGKTEEGIAALWKSLHRAVDDVVPAGMRNHRTYRIVMGLTDGLLSDLSRHVIGYRRAMLEAKVCYKNTIPRSKVRPHVCREGFAWDGGHLCLPDKETGAHCYRPCGNKAGFCPGFCGDRVCCRNGHSGDPDECEGATGYVDRAFTKGSSRDYHQCVVPKLPVLEHPVMRRSASFGSHPALCDPTSPYNENHGDWCATKCPDGFRDKTNGYQCRQLCLGKFPANGKSMCGTNPAELTSVYTEMATIVLSSAVKLGILIPSLLSAEMSDVGELIETINTLIDLGKPFAKPVCPLPYNFLTQPETGESALFEVEGTGDRRLNGEWFKVGEHSGRARYRKMDDDKATLEWSESRWTWRFFYDNWHGWGRKTLYQNSENTLLYPRDGWETVEGPDPGPVLLKVESPLRMSEAERQLREATEELVAAAGSNSISRLRFAIAEAERVGVSSTQVSAAEKKLALEQGYLAALKERRRVQLKIDQQEESPPPSALREELARADGAVEAAFDALEAWKWPTAAE